MQLRNAKVLITGAAGGIGRAAVAGLVTAGAQVLMVDRDSEALAAMTAQFGAGASQVEARAVDVSSAEQRDSLCEMARGWRGGINILINNAGVNPFGFFETQGIAQIERALAINLHAPMHLCHALLPHLRTQAPAAILNTGSVFGQIGFPGYVAYSTTKFALRGFTEALRRELAGSGVAIQYLAPRATRTPINSSSVTDMNRELGVAMDTPERVAEEMLALLTSGRPAKVIGWPEKAFVKINATFPSLVDRSIRGQMPVIERYGRPEPRIAPTTDQPATSVLT